MTTLKEIERRVETLERKLYLGEQTERLKDDWLWDAREATQAAHSLESAFEWEDCPIQPNSFNDWYSLFIWLRDLGEE